MMASSLSATQTELLMPPQTKNEGEREKPASFDRSDYLGSAMRSL